MNKLIREVNNDGKGWMIFLVPIVYIWKWYYDMLHYIRKKYWKYKNKTQKEALIILNDTYPNNKTQKCQICGFSTAMPSIFQNHMSEDHGFPSDMIVEEYTKDVKIPICNNVQRANPTYLKYL